MLHSVFKKTLPIFILTGISLFAAVMPVMASPVQIIYEYSDGQYVQAGYLKAITHTPMKKALLTALSTDELANLNIYVTDDNGKTINYTDALNKSIAYSVALNGSITYCIPPTPVYQLNEDGTVTRISLNLSNNE